MKSVLYILNHYLSLYLVVSLLFKLYHIMDGNVVIAACVWTFAIWRITRIICSSVYLAIPKVRDEEWGIVNFVSYSGAKRLVVKNVGSKK